MKFNLMKVRTCLMKFLRCKDMNGYNEDLIMKLVEKHSMKIRNLSQLLGDIKDKMEKNNMEFTKSSVEQSVFWTNQKNRLKTFIKTRNMH